MRPIKTTTGMNKGTNSIIVGKDNIKAKIYIKPMIPVSKTVLTIKNRFNIFLFFLLFIKQKPAINKNKMINVISRAIFQFPNR